MRRRRAAQQPGSGIVLVAEDVGGSGGMESQLERLVLGLLDTGRQVTVIARTCGIDPHERLRFVRVWCPARPFCIAYPALFMVASVLALRHKGDVLHTTGAIIANRADVSTVHYCHKAAGKILTTSRSSRPTFFFRLNGRVAGSMARAGERWCYRPSRTTYLCAVSSGLASELSATFPEMASRVRRVANGVDVTEFRPDGASRSAVRSRLRLEDSTLVALFVGGDWDRKGLAHAIGALSNAPEWHLIVAGDGDGDGVRQRAKGAGVSDRLHLLGATAHMAPVYAAADAFVLPTAYETFSLVTYEAAASELPLLVTRVSGVEDLLCHGHNGWFIERDADNIAARLSSLSDDRDLMKRMALRARQDALSFSWAEMVAGYEDAYWDLTNADR